MNSREEGDIHKDPQKLKFMQSHISISMSRRTYLQFLDTGLKFTVHCSMYNVHSVPIYVKYLVSITGPIHSLDWWSLVRDPIFCIFILYLHVHTPDMYCLIRTEFLFHLISVCLSECTYSTVMYVSLSLGSVCCWSLCLSACTVLYNCRHVCLYVCFFVCLSVSLPVCLFASLFLFVCLPVRLFACLSDYLSVCLQICLSACLSVCLIVSLPICLLVCLCLSSHLAVCLSDSLSLSLSVLPVGMNTYLTECRTVCLPSYRPACLSV